MSHNQLIPVFAGHIAGAATQLCDARTLHVFLQVKRDFTDWVKGRIRKFKFVAGEDFIAVANLSSPNLGSANLSSKARAQKLTDYHLTLDMAKELSMVENNEQGRAARRYFISCEKQALAQQPARPYNPAIDYERISPAQAQDLKELVHSIVDAKVQGFGETWNRLHRKFRVNSYLELPATKFDEARDYLLGKLPPEAATAQPDPVAVPTLMGRRWLIATTPDGQETVLPIAHSAMVVSAEDLPARIEQGDFFASDLLLARIASAVAAKQGQRAMFRERQLLSA